MKKVTRLCTVIAPAMLLAALVPATARADPDDDGDHRRHRHERREYQVEYREGDCKIKRKQEKNGAYEEERKCRPARHAYASDVAEQREHKEEFQDGDCRVKRKWEKNGEYEEEIKCRPPRHRHEPEVIVGQPVVVVQPPWLVVEQGEPSYRPGWEPAPPPRSENLHHCNSTTVGSVLGGIVGGLAGHQAGGGRGQTAATIGGAIAGVLIGGEIGRRMDAQDQACIGQALEFAPAGKRVGWHDPHDAQTRYVVVPGDARQQGRTYCRPYTMIVSAGGRQQQTSQTACRQSDGTWIAHR